MMFVNWLRSDGFEEEHIIFHLLRTILELVTTLSQAIGLVFYKMYLYKVAWT